jgi:hypothetical protein
MKPNKTKEDKNQTKFQYIEKFQGKLTKIVFLSIPEKSLLT